MNSQIFSILMSTVLLASLSNPAESLCLGSNRSYEQPNVNFIRIEFAGAHTQQAKNQFRAAMNQWNDPSCNTMNGPPSNPIREFPQFSEAGGQSVLKIVHQPDVGDNCSKLAGLEILYWDKVKNPSGGADLNCNRENGAMVDTFAHELGHRLGLRDIDPGCGDRIMGPRVIAGGVYQARAISVAECNKVADTNHTQDELYYDEIECQTPGSACHDGDYDYCSPIVIHLENGEEAEFTSPQKGVYFDLDGGGRDLVSWTQGKSNTALLVWDRNGNGKIDDGTELFGTATPLLGGGLARMGYEALAELDSLEEGGNGNGWFEPADAHWRSLQLWIDWDHNGRSNPGELMSLDDGGVYGIKAVGIPFSSKKDEHGNWFKWSSPAYLQRDGESFVTESVDVFFVHARKYDQ